MKAFRFQSLSESCKAFSLVESVFSLGVLSFGFLALVPLLALGLTSAGGARGNIATSRIACTLIEQARQGAATAGTNYFDSTGNPCAPAGAAYASRGTSTPVVAGSGSVGAGPLTRLTLQIIPLGSPGSARIYADVFPTPPAP